MSLQVRLSQSALWPPAPALQSATGSSRCTSTQLSSPTPATRQPLPGTHPSPTSSPPPWGAPRTSEAAHLPCCTCVTVHVCSTPCQCSLQPCYTCLPCKQHPVHNARQHILEVSLHRILQCVCWCTGTFQTAAGAQSEAACFIQAALCAAQLSVILLCTLPVRPAVTAALPCAGAYQSFNGA